MTSRDYDFCIISEINVDGKDFWNFRTWQSRESGNQVEFVLETSWVVRLKNDVAVKKTRAFNEI